MPSPPTSENDDQIHIEAFEADKYRSRAKVEEKRSSPAIEKVFDLSPLMPQSNHREEVDVDDEEEDVDVDDARHDRLFDQKQWKILAIRRALKIPINLVFID